MGLQYLQHINSAFLHHQWKHLPDRSISCHRAKNSKPDHPETRQTAETSGTCCRATEQNRTEQNRTGSRVSQRGQWKRVKSQHIHFCSPCGETANCVKAAIITVIWYNVKYNVQQMSSDACQTWVESGAIELCVFGFDYESRWWCVCSGL